MISIVGTEYRVDTIFAGWHPCRIFGEVRTTLVMAIDVLPGLCINERKLIWGQAYDRAIILVKLVASLSQITLEKSRNVGNA